MNLKKLIRGHCLLFVSLTTVNLLSAQYSYDSNGNMVSDVQKGIDTIEYNDLNLVKRVVKGKQVISYDYDAAGTRLSKTVTDSTDIPQVHYYADGFEYEGNQEDLLFFATEEGRVTPQKPGFNYEYNLKDHLGNTRVSFDKDPSAVKARIIQTNSYYPFGEEQPGNSYVIDQPNNYLYNGKERQEELGLYDYGARMYDPEIARWNRVDPLAEKYATWSPYNYVLNNPLKYIDPDGRDVESVVDDENRKISITVRANFTPVAGLDLTQDKIAEWSNGVNKALSKTLETGPFKGYKVEANLVSIINGGDVYDSQYFPMAVSSMVTGSERANSGLLYVQNNGLVAAHEVGHLMGNPDEYREKDANNDGKIEYTEIEYLDPTSIMSNHLTGVVKDEHLYTAIEKSSKDPIVQGKIEGWKVAVYNRDVYFPRRFKRFLSDIKKAGSEPKAIDKIGQTITAVTNLSWIGY